MDNQSYILGTGDVELDRLARQHDVWRDVTGQLWEAAQFGPGERLLDLGCGPGFASLELAERVAPGGRVTALDNSERFIGVLQDWVSARGINNLDARRGDATHIDVPAGSMDGVYIRWLLCFLPDTHKVIKQAAATLAPGGRLVVMDYFNYLSIRSFPNSEIFNHVFERIHQSFADAGGNLDVGDSLPGLMHEAGLEILHTRPIINAVRPGSAIWQWVRGFQRSYLPRLVEQGYLSEADLEANDRDWQARAEDPASFFLSPPMLGVVARKPRERRR